MKIFPKQKLSVNFKSCDFYKDLNGAKNGGRVVGRDTTAEAMISEEGQVKVTTLIINCWLKGDFSDSVIPH